MSADASASASDRPTLLLTTSSSHGSNASVSNFLRHSDSSRLTSFNDSCTQNTTSVALPVRELIK